MVFDYKNLQVSYCKDKNFCRFIKGLNGVISLYINKIKRI